MEENPRKVEHVLKAREEWTRKGKEGERPGPLEIDTQSEDYQRKLNRLIDHEVPLFLSLFPKFCRIFLPSAADQSERKHYRFKH